jgi:hypothetical protein
MNTRTPTEPKIGDKMPDGTIYAGMSPDTKKPMYAMSQDAPMTMTFHEAAVYAAKLNAHGHQDWRAPTKGELKVLSDHHVAIGGFDLTGSTPSGWYWSASKYYKRNAWVRRFSAGRDRLVQGAPGTGAPRVHQGP